jgi:hypothetical protein
MNHEVHEYYKTCDQCQQTGNILMQNLAKLVTTLSEKSFQKWNLDFIGLDKPPSRLTKNWYILVAIDYATKWVEAQAFHTNTAAITVKFLYEHIFTKFDYRNRSKYPFYQQCYQISYKSFYF